MYWNWKIEQQAYAHGRKLILCCSNGIPEHIPLIAFDRQFENHQIARIASDNYEGGILATKKLLEFGCKSPVFIGFHSPFPGEADKRFSGYLDTCRKYQIPPVYLHASDSENSYVLIVLLIIISLGLTSYFVVDKLIVNKVYHEQQIVTIDKLDFKNYKNILNLQGRLGETQQFFKCKNSEAAIGRVLTRQ